MSSVRMEILHREKEEITSDLPYTNSSFCCTNETKEAGELFGTLGTAAATQVLI